MKKKRILSLLLVFLLCFNIMPVFASDETMPEGATFYYRYVISDTDYDAGARFDETYYENVKSNIENGSYKSNTIVGIERLDDNKTMILYMGSAAGTEVDGYLQPYEETQPEVDTGSTLIKFEGWTGVDTTGKEQTLSSSYYVGGAIQTYYGQNNTTFTSSMGTNYGFTYTLTIGEGQSIDEAWYHNVQNAIDAGSETGVLAIEKSENGKTYTLYFDDYNFYKTTLSLPDVTLADTSDTVFDNAWSDGDYVLDITHKLSVDLAYTDSGNKVSIYATNLNLSPVIATKTYTVHIDPGEGGSLIDEDDYASYVSSGYTVSADENGNLVISGISAGDAGFSLDEAVIKINAGKMLDGFDLDTTATDSAVSCSIADENGKWQFTDFASSDTAISHDIYVTAVYANEVQLYVSLPDGARVDQSGIDGNSDITSVDSAYTNDGYLIISAKEGTAISLDDILIYDGFYTTTTVVAGQDGTSADSLAAAEWTEITDATVTTEPSALDLTYTGEAQALVTAGAASGGALYYSLTNTVGSWSLAVPTATEAGTYTVYYKVIGDAYHNDVGPVSIDAEIAKAAPTVTAPTANADLIYTGEAQTLVAAGATTAGTMYYSLTGGENDWSTETPTGTDAGTYEVYYKVVGDDNYKSTEAGTVNVTISKTAPTVTAPTAEANLVYTGGVQALVAAGATTGGTMYYSLTGGENDWDTEIPTGTNAGTYTVYYKVVEDTNYKSTETGTVSVTISKADPDVTEPPARIATVGQTLSEVDLPTGWAWEDSSVSLDSAGVQLFAATYTPDDTDNYNTATASLSVTVEAVADTDFKAMLLTLDQFTVDMSEETYTGSEIKKEVTSSTLTEGTDYTVSYSGNKNAGTAAITITGTGDYSGTLNYNFIISKADPTCTIPTGLTATAGQTLSGVTLPAGWTWEDGSVSVGSTGVKLFRAVYTPDDADNYNTVTANLTVTVEADANVSLTSLTVDDFTVDMDPEVYTGAAITKTIESGTLKEGTDYQVFYSDNTEAGVAVITIAGTGSYTGTLTYNFIIEQVAGESDIPDNIPDVDILEATVGESLSDVALPNGWSWEEDSESVGNEGVKLFRAYYTPTVAMYNTLRANRTVLTATLYAGATYSLTANLSAGTAYYLTVKVTADANSASPASLALDQFTVDMNSVSYTGNATTKTIVSDTSLVEGKDYLVFYSENTDAGVAVITIVGTGSYTGTLTYNYIIEQADVTSDSAYTVPADLTVTAGQTLSDVTLPSGWTWEDDTVSVGSTGVKVFRAVYTPQDTDNYSTVTTYLTVTVEAVPHTHTPGEAVKEKEVTATCTEDGSYDNVVYCTECGEEVSRETVTIPATGHSYESVVTEPTCTTGGYTTHTCTVCGHSYVDSETEATGHSFGEWETVSSPNCENKGSERRTCTVCGFVETENLDAAGHDWEEDYTVDREATCTTDGSRSIHCKNCDAVKGSETIPATGHTLALQNAKDATCIEEGYTGDIVCRICGEVISAGEVIAATGHSWDEGVVTKAATCTEPGVKTYTCTACGETKTEEISATGHNYEVAAVIEPTYTEAGYTIYTCANCGDSYVADYTAILIIDGTDEKVAIAITVQELTVLPDGLKTLYSSLAGLKADLTSRVTISEGYTTENAVIYDVTLQYQIDGGEWVEATEENFPEGGITVTIPYPEGTDGSSEFVVVHMFTATSERLGIVAGGTENPAVTKTADGLVVTLTGLSPVAVAWKTVSSRTEPASAATNTDSKTTEAGNTTATGTDSKPSEGGNTTAAATQASGTSLSTGDNSLLTVWITLLVISGIGAAGVEVCSRKKRIN